MKHGKEWRERQAAGVKKAWAEGKYKNARRPDYTVIAAKNRGRVRPIHARLATARGIREAHRRGVYSTPEAKRNHSAGQRARTDKRGGTPERMHEIRSMRDLEKLRTVWRRNGAKRIEEWRKTGKLQEILDKAHARLRGSHGFGRGEMGRLDHAGAKAWRVSSPTGEVFEFTNLREWARRNEHRFVDARPESKMPFHARIAAGLKNLDRPTRPNASTHYLGWTTVASFEKEDLLQRS